MSVTCISCTVSFFIKYTLNSVNVHAIKKFDSDSLDMFFSVILQYLFSRKKHLSNELHNKCLLSYIGLVK